MTSQKTSFLFLHKNVLWKLFLLTGMRKSENDGMCSYNIPNVWWFGWPYLYSYTMFKLDKWDTKVLVGESWNSSFVWLAEPICHGYMSTLLNSWDCCWSLLLLQLSSVITYVIRLNFWKGSFLLASALIHTPQQVRMGSWARFIKTKFAHLSIKQRISFRIFDIYFPHRAWALTTTLSMVQKIICEKIWKWHFWKCIF